MSHELDKKMNLKEYVKNRVNSPVIVKQNNLQEEEIENTIPKLTTVLLGLFNEEKFMWELLQINQDNQVRVKFE